MDKIQGEFEKPIYNTIDMVKAIRAGERSRDEEIKKLKDDLKDIELGLSSHNNHLDTDFDGRSMLRLWWIAQETLDCTRNPLKDGEL